MVMYHAPREEDFFITVRVVIEVMAKKPEVATKALQDYIKSIKDPASAPEIRVLSHTVAEPKEQEGGAFTNYVEADLKFASVASLIGYCFDALPSSVDILEPDNLKLDTADLTGLLNDLMARLHKVNFELANLRGNYSIIEANSTGLLRNFMIHLVKNGEKSEEDVARTIGLSKDALRGIVTKYLHESPIVLKDGKYTVTEKVSKT